MALNLNLTHLACFACELSHPADQLQTVCTACGMPLSVVYDLSKTRLTPQGLVGRVPNLWRYREVLPLADGEVSLHEGFTPVVQVGKHRFVKDESRNPTGSFKARGMTAAVSMARALGAKSLKAPSAGNAAGALAAYGAAAGLPVVVAMPKDTPKHFVAECEHYGAEVHLVPGTISDAGKFLKENGPSEAFDVSTLKEPYRVEGKKTMGYELFEQFEGKLPDVVAYPTGGGTGLVGMWKAWNEMEQLGFIGAERPRLVCVQAAGCQPIVSAFSRGESRSEPWPNPQTTAWGLRVPSPIGGFICLRAIRETKGTAIAVEERDTYAATSELAKKSGIDICPEGGAVWAAVNTLTERGFIKESDDVVIFNTGTGLKYR